MEDLIFQIKDVQTDTDDLFEHPLQELLGLDTQLRSIRGSLKVEVAKKVQLEERIAEHHCKLKEFQEYPGVYDGAMREDIAKQAQFKAVTSCSTHKIDQQETDG